MSMGTPLCTTIVCSCDAYRDLWPAFFRLVKTYWENPWPILLNTEREAYSFPGLNIRTTSPWPEGEQPAWGARLLRALDEVSTNYVLILLEDFFFKGPVDEIELNRCLQAMEADENIAVFSFLPAPGKNIPSEKYKGYLLREQTADFRFNCQAAIWRKDRLKQFILPSESAWEWEQTGNARSYLLSDEFYCVPEGGHQAIDYDPYQHGVYNGKWLEDVPKLFAQHGIEMDFSKRGFFDEKQRALHPQIGIDFCCNATLYTDCGNGFSEATALHHSACHNTTGLDCAFTLPYELQTASAIRLDPTESGYCMFSSLSIVLTYTDGFSESFNMPQFGTNGIAHAGKLVFFCEDPMIWLYPRTNKRLAQVLAMGEAVPRIPEAVIDSVMNKLPNRWWAKLQHLRARLPF